MLAAFYTMMWQILDIDKFYVNVAGFSYCDILQQRSFGDTTVGRKTTRKPVTWAAELV